MKLDKQRRLTIPQFIRESGRINKLQKYYLVYVKDNLYRLEKEDDDERLVALLKVDAKGRITIPAYILDDFKGNVRIYAQKGKVWLKITP